MLILRTILLWIAFSFLIVLEFISTPDFRFGIIIRLIPSFLLLAWFLLYITGKERYKFKESVNNKTIYILTVIRKIANFLILSGAILKLLHEPFSQPLLIAGIGCLALWSNLLINVSIEKSTYNPEIIDDELDDFKED